MKKTDLLWILAYPLYQLISTFRHEGGHALFAWLEGAQIQEFVFWPSVHEKWGFMWGYVRWEGDTTWLSIAAPYFIDLLTFLLFFWLCMRYLFKHRWLWINAIAIGLISPFINSIYNYWGGLDSLNDVGKLLRDLPNIPVHLYFIFTLTLYLVGTVVAFRSSPTAKEGRKKFWILIRPPLICCADILPLSSQKKRPAGCSGARNSRPTHLLRFLLLLLSFSFFLNGKFGLFLFRFLTFIA